MQRANIIVGLIKKNDLKVGYEIGCSNGYTYRNVLSRCEDMHWHGVDPWVVCPEYTKRPNGVKWNHEGNYEVVKSIAEEYGDRAHIHRMTSVEAAKEVEDGSIDIVFIDGLHTYEGVRDDLEAWVPKIKVGGIISGHDYACCKHKGVTIAVDERFGKKNITKEKDMVWWLYKTEDHDGVGPDIS